MKNEQPENREERAVDALIAAALRQPEEVEPSAAEIREFLALPKPISAEAQQALEQLGPDVVKRLILAPSETEGQVPEFADEPLYAAMHRKNKTGKHDPKTEEELEKKRKEILERLKKKKQDGGAK